MSKSYEDLRLEKLRELRLLDTLNEPQFDDIVKIATSICETPAALISLIDEKRQWFKACVGLSAKESSREIAFCDHTIRTRDPMIVTDATQDPRFRDNPFVVGLPGIRFYAGVPLWTVDGYCIGSLCVIDLVVRNLKPSQLEGLQALSRQLMLLIETRSAFVELEFDRLDLKKELRELRGDVLRKA